MPAQLSTSFFPDHPLTCSAIAEETELAFDDDSTGRLWNWFTVGQRCLCSANNDKTMIDDTRPKTTSTVRSGDFTSVTQEFGRTGDVQKIFGLKRGTTYNLLADGKIKGVLLRVRGNKSGVRLFDMESVREFIRRSMN